jgi:hypothetical protein
MDSGFKGWLFERRLALSYLSTAPFLGNQEFSDIALSLSTLDRSCHT